MAQHLLDHGGLDLLTRGEGFEGLSVADSPGGPDDTVSSQPVENRLHGAIRKAVAT
jgi:hypothetical protein